MFKGELLVHISFYGIKNAGAYTNFQEKAQILNTNRGSFILPRGRRIDFQAELNNKNGNDLDEFKNILKAYPNKYNPNILKVTYEWFINPNNGEKMRIYAVNDNILDINKITFPVFNKVFMLMKKVSQMPEKELIVDNSYLKTTEAKNAFKYYSLLENKPIENILDEAHTRDNVKNGADALSKKFANVLTEYILN